MPQAQLTAEKFFLVDGILSISKPPPLPFFSPAPHYSTVLVSDCAERRALPVNPFKLLVFLIKPITIYINGFMKITFAKPKEKLTKAVASAKKDIRRISPYRYSTELSVKGTAIRN